MELAGIAQLVEQWIENPRVTSSTLVPGNKLINEIRNELGFVSAHLYIYLLNC